MNIGEPKIDERPDQPYMGSRTQVPHQELPIVIPQHLDMIFAWLRENNIEPAGIPFIRYHVIDMDGKMDIEMGVPVAQQVAGNDQIKAGVLPAGKYASLVYADVRIGIEANGALIDWARKQGLEWDRWDDPNGDAFASRYESFITDPEDEPDMEKWETEVAIKLA